MKKSPCFGCKERYSACQDTCKRGSAWAEKERERRAKIAAARKADMEPKSTIIELKEALKRR